MNWLLRAAFVNVNPDRLNLNCNNNLHHNGRSRRMTPAIFTMITYTKLYNSLCSYDNLLLAHLNARRGKTKKLYVIEFEKNLQQNLQQLREELLFQTYKPRPLQTFILHDPKTRKISRSDYRDRVVHHALCNIIEPIFEKRFIYDSYANRKGKGTLKAVKRFDEFKRKVSHNFTRSAYVLKADVYHYFEEVNKAVLVSIIQRIIRDEKVLWLIKNILSNYHGRKRGKSMPLGNLTSQFFANVYLNELDQFVKQKLKVKHYIRYVDDFAIFGSSSDLLGKYKHQINCFLHEKLSLQLHPDKSRIISLEQGTDFLGLKIFPYHKLIKRRNLRTFLALRFCLSWLYLKHLFPPQQKDIPAKFIQISKSAVNFI